MRQGLIITAVLLIIVIVGVTIALSRTVSDKNLTAAELDGINQSCIECHRNDLTDGSMHGVHVELDCFFCHDNSHKVHASEDCKSCHAGTAGLKTADRAYDTLKWVGIGVAGLVVATLAFNLIVSRHRLRKREK